MAAGNKQTMVSLALVGLLLLCHLAATASAKNNVHLNSFKMSGSESEGRVVYADMKMVKTSVSDAPAPAPSPSSSDD